MNTLPSSNLFTVATEAVAPSTSKHHIAGKDAVKIDGGELILATPAAQN
ncbi:hypothetical protein ACFPOB_17695 [Bosea eneae]|uniref:Uncharacterized protein n=1 Tax=Bosea eneae TaxID=151454 RepID=A0ABW0IT49_9HYPH